MSTKIVKSRDSATALLRKIGVAPTDYTLYIEKHVNGFEVFLDEAAQAVGGAPRTQDQEPAVESAEMDAKREAILAKVFDKPAKAKPSKKAKAPETPEKQDFYVERYMAHDYLVSIGINEADTGKHIKKTKQGYTIVATEAPAKVKAKVKAEKKVAEPKVKAVKQAKDESSEAKLARMTEGNSMSCFMRKCIVDGMTNKEAVEAAAKKFRWTPEQAKAKAWFGAWYAHDCRRHGLIANTLANGNEGQGKPRSVRKEA